jgi:hypothetical protein
MAKGFKLGRWHGGRGRGPHQDGAPFQSVAGRLLAAESVELVAPAGQCVSYLVSGFTNPSWPPWTGSLIQTSLRNSNRGLSLGYQGKGPLAKGLLQPGKILLNFDYVSRR